MIVRRRAAALVVALSLATAACGGSGGDAEPASTGSADVATEPEATEPEATEPAATEPEASEPAASDPATSDAPEAPAEPDDPATVPPILDFTANLVGGGTLDAATLAGRPTAFWFWAPT